MVGGRVGEVVVVVAVVVVVVVVVVKTSPSWGEVLGLVLIQNLL